MKKVFAFFVALCCLFTSLPFSCHAAESTSSIDALAANLQQGATAVLLDSEGNKIKDLDIDLTLTQEQNTRSSGTTYTLTYRASETKADSDSSYKSGVTAVGTITWNDITGTTNVLVSVSGQWITGYDQVSNKTVEYGVKNMLSEIVDGPFKPFENTTVPNPFSYEPINCTGFMFYLTTTAKIVSTGETIAVTVYTSATT